MLPSYVSSGQKMRFLGFCPNIQPAYRKQLLSLGLVPNAIVEIIRVAPLGCPIEVRWRNTQWMMRKHDFESCSWEKVE